jgi:hypothetical protein
MKELTRNYPQKLSIVAIQSSYELANYPKTISYNCANSSHINTALAMAKILKKGNYRAISGVLPVTARIDS